MKSPSLYTLAAPAVTARTGEGWVPARSLGYPSFGSRLRIAWLVFTGKADAFTWPGGQ